VGRLRDDTLFYQGRLYTMAQHGFARDKSFQIEQVTETSATLRLRADQATREQYPSEFVLEAAYELQPNALGARFVVRNPGPELLPASFGVHPAFRWPLGPDGDKSSYTIRFDKDEAPGIRRLKNGLLQKKVHASPIRRTILPLSESLFQDDAIIILGGVRGVPRAKCPTCMDRLLRFGCMVEKPGELRMH
jgi:galactose mutarotase-like enzyme